MFLPLLLVIHPKDGTEFVKLATYDCSRDADFGAWGRISCSSTSAIHGAERSSFAVQWKKVANMGVNEILRIIGFETENHNTKDFFMLKKLTYMTLVSL